MNQENSSDLQGASIPKAMCFKINEDQLSDSSDTSSLEDIDDIVKTENYSLKSWPKKGEPDGFVFRGKGERFAKAVLSLKKICKKGTDMSVKNSKVHV